MLVDIDIVKNTGGKKLYENYGLQPGVPAWTIMDSDQKVLEDPLKDKENAGFPWEPHEVAHFFAAPKKSCPALSEEELKVLKERLDEHCKVRKAEIGDVDDASHLLIVLIDFPQPDRHGSYIAQVSIGEVYGLIEKAFEVGADYQQFGSLAFLPWERGGQLQGCT